MLKYLIKISKFLLVLILITGWIFSGWPQIYNFPPEIEQVLAATAGPSFPTSGVNDTSIGTTAWTSPGNVTASENTRATVTLAKNSGVSQAIKATGFGFAIPSDAQINGITVEWETSENGDAAAGGIQDNAVRLVRAGTIETTDLSNTTFWVAPASETFVTYGGVANLWGAAWTAADINNANFGAAISAKNVKASGGGAIESANVDSVRITITYTLPTYQQSGYRFFANTDTTDVGTALAALNATSTLGSTGAAFRLRMLLHVGTSNLAISGQAFKLLFAGAGAGGNCASPGGTPSWYTDVTSTTTIAYKNNTTPNDGDTLTFNANDPTHNADTIVDQTYEELNNFTNSVAAIPATQDGKWDFALVDNGAPASTAYCFRAVKSDYTVLNTYTVYPAVITAGATSFTFTIDTPSVTFVGGLTPGTPVSTSSVLTINTNSSNGYNITINRASTTPTLFLSSYTISDTPNGNNWTAPAATSTAGPSALWTSGITKGLGFRIRQTVTVTNTYSSIWWGTDDTSGNAKYSGISTSTPVQKIADTTLGSGSNEKTVVEYKIDVNSNQRSGAYTSSPIIFTATTNP